MEYSSSPHRPLHIYIDDAWYFITGSTINRAKFFISDEHLHLWREVFLATAEELSVTVCAWVVLSSHYHALLKFQHGRDLSKFVQRLHGRTSHKVNVLDNLQGRKIWYSYWDTCIRGETDFWTRFNYIHYNPVKHGYVHNPEDWEYSSYRFYLQEEGDEWLAKCWLNYPAKDLLQEDNE